MTGQIRLQDGSLPLERVMVTLEARGITINSAYCDNEGRFYFYNLPANPYRVSIDAEGYQPVQQIVYVNPTISQNTFVRMVLRPREKPGRETPPDPASGGNPYLVNLADYLKKWPRRAVKEYEAAVKSDEHGKVDEAIRHYKKAIQIAPDFYPARNNLGVKYVGRGELAAAESEFAQVIQMHPADPQAYFNLGNVFYLTKRFTEAERACQEGLRKGPDSAFGHHLLGSIQMRLGAMERAEQSLRSAQELDPQMSKTLLELANLYLLQQKRAEAIRELKSFLQHFPRDPMLPKVKDVLQRLEAGTAQPQ